MKMRGRTSAVRSRWPEALRRSPLIAWARPAAILPAHADTWVLALRPDSLAAKLVDPAYVEFDAAPVRLNVLRELRVVRGGFGTKGNHW